MRPEETSPESNSSPATPDVNNSYQEDVTANKPIIDADNETDTRPGSEENLTETTPVRETSVQEPRSTFGAPVAGPVPTPPEAPSEAPVAASPVVSGGGGSSKKPLLIGVAAVVVALLAGGYAAYALWWNTPNKVVDDALASVVMAKNGTANGTATVTSEGSPAFNFSFDAKSVDQKTQTTLNANTTVDGKEYKVNGTFVTDKDTYYIKMNDLKKTLSSIYGDSSIVSTFDPIVSKIDGKWVVVTPDDVKRIAGEDVTSNKETTCVQNVLDGVKKNQTQQKELADVYQKNRFIYVKESKGTEAIDGVQSNHYVMGIDQDKAVSFGNAIVNTSVFKSVDDCVSQDLKKEFLDTNKKDTQASTSTTTTELWVDMWSHKPTKIKVTSDSKTGSKLTFESKFKFDTNVDITTPKADTTVKDIESEIQKLQQDFSVPTSEI